MADAAGDLVLISKANAGIPQWKGAELHYDGTPEVMAAHADRVRALGVGIIGACCGSSAAHLAYMRQVLDGIRPVPVVDAPAAPAADRTTGTRRRTRRRSA